MREDLPCDDHLPRLWSLSLVAGGDVVVDAPQQESCMSLFSVLEEMDSPTCSNHHRCWRVKEKEDNVRRILQELRLNLPERVAIPQLGRLRELMFREACLLDSLDHECVVRLECAWLEQRVCETPRGLGDSLSDRQGATAGKNNPVIPTAKRRDEGSGGFAQKACWLLQSVEQSAPNSSASNTQHRCRSRSLTNSCPSICDEDPVAALRPFVPWTVEEQEADSDFSDTEEGKQGMPISGRRGNIERQPCWGGDQSTRWMGAAEPKGPTTKRACPTAGSTCVGQRVGSSLRERSVAMGRTESVVCRQEDDRVDANIRTGDDCLCLIASPKMISVAAYLLMPDGKTLGEWLETEFEPRIAPDEQGVAMAVTTAGDWARVWGKLLHMFLQVVRGVEYLHVQGIVHNGISTDSVWVGADGVCRIGSVGHATPPGRRRPPTEAGPLQHFFSPERRRGDRVDSHSDVFSLGILLRELWCAYLRARGFGRNSVDEVVTSKWVELGRPVDASDLLDFELVKQMLANDPFDRPDCFELIHSLGGLVTDENCTKP